MTAPGSNTCGHDDHSPAEASSAMTTKCRGYKDGGVRKSPDGRWEGTADFGVYGSGRRRKYVYGRTRAEVVERLRSVQRTVTEGLSRNVATLVEPVSVARAPVAPFAPEEVNAILEAAAVDRLGTFYTVALAVGLRPSEALGLKWADVDLSEGLLRVQRVLERRGQEWTFKEPSPGPAAAPSPCRGCASSN